MNPDIDVTPKQRKIILSLLKAYLPNTTVWAYGSRARWAAQPYSDLDLVAFATAEQESKVYALKEAFEESDLPFKVDLFVWDDVPEEFKPNIEKERVVLVERDEESSTRTLAECCTDTISYGVVQLGNHTPDGVPIVRVNNIKNNRIELDDVLRIAPEVEKKYERTRLKGGEVLLTLVGTTGQSAVVPDSLAGYNVPRAVAVIRPKTEVGPAWVDYCLRSAQTAHFLDARANTTVQKTLNLKDIRDVPIPMPPKSQRDKITHILGTLDDRIELNRRMNETLKAMAQALFKSWFVDFDPVKAKMEGKQPEGMDVETAALFPDKLVESELGLIPEGWKALPLSKTIKLIGGGTPKKSVPEYWGGDIPWFSIKDMPNGSDVFIAETELLITERGLNKSSAKLLPVGTTIISARGTVGKLGIVHKPMAMNQSCYGVVGAKGYGPYFNYYNLNSAVQTLMNNTHGAVFDTITRKTFDTYSWAFPRASLASRYEAIVEPIMQRIAQNVGLNVELQQARDTLLPKLISGELEVQ